MRHSRRSAVLFIAVLIIIFALPAFAAKLRPTGESAQREVIIRMKNGASANDVSALEHLADADRVEKISALRSGALWHLHSRSKNVDALITALEKNPNVEYVEPNYVVQMSATPNDPSYGQLWGLKNTGQVVNSTAGFAGVDISAEGAWNLSTGSSSIVVGVVDTGIDYNHPDLAANVWSNPGGKGNPQCAAGTHGFNAITLTCDPKDDHYHGTHVSGTIGAVGNNGVGVAGVNWTVSIMGLKFLDSGGYGSTANAIRAIDFAVQAKIDGVNVRVLSNSWGGGEFSKALLDEINKANENDILFVASAGNDGVNTDATPQYPSGYATANMISVAATDSRDALAYFSNYGAASVHLGAPGVSVYSTMPNGAYGTLSGTSMACPHVAGVAALVLAQTPSMTTAQVKAAILDNTDPISGLYGRTVTGGRLNAARALGAPAQPDFTITLSPLSRTVVHGASATYTIGITPANGFASAVSLAITGLPAGITPSFNPASTTSTSTLTLSTTEALYANAYTFAITATGGGRTRGISGTINITTTPPLSTCPGFATRIMSYGSLSSSAAAVVDLNRDGRPDLVLASAVNGNVRTLLGTGTGGFTSGTYGLQPVGAEPLSMAVGDFNGDGKPDVVTGNSNSGNVSVLLGVGDGNLQSAVNYAAGTSPFGVVTRDFNRDGRLDIAVASNGSGAASVLLGNGDGTFQSAIQYGTIGGPFAITSGDFNADGIADLAVAASHNGKMSILLGNGDGTFGANTDFAAGSSPSAVAAGDVNNDGRLDLAVTNADVNGLSILIGNGDGTFQAPVQYAVGTGPNSVAFGDFNNDARLDLVTANTTGSTASVLIGTGNGAFQQALNYPTDPSPMQAVIGDFNGDGRNDFATVAEVYAYYSSYYLSVFLNNGLCSQNCNTLASAVNYGVGSTPVSSVSGDFNNDGRADLAVANNATDNVSVLIGNGDGTLNASVNYGAGTAPESVTAGDFNRDGKLDLAVANVGSNNVSVLIGNGNGTLQTGVSYGAGTAPKAVAAGDFNRDGKLDLAVANSGSNNVSILIGNGNGTMQSAVDYAAGTTPRAVAAGDFNRDGKSDLAVANFGSNNISILIGNGDGTFQAATNISAGTAPVAIAAGDLDGDGKIDLAIANSGSNSVSVRIGNGNGTFQSAADYTAGTAPAAVTIADLNDDALPDLAVANNGSNNVSVLLGVGGGAFAGAVNSAVLTNPTAVTAADFNRDGKPDLAVVNGSATSVAILLNTCPVPDLTVTKTHSGTFTQADTGKTYTVTVTNAGLAPTTGTVIVSEIVPAGLTSVAMSGTGWTCSGTSCNRSDVLAAGGSWPAITVTVNVTNSAPATVTNRVTVSGGGELNTINDSASDPTTVAPVTDLVITSTHSGSFTQGDSARTWILMAKNAGGLPTSGTVTVSDVLPPGVTPSSMSGTGWNCVLGSLTCTRSDVLGATSAYPPISLVVAVASDAPTLVTNVATVAGGGDANTGNNTGSDPTAVWSRDTCASLGAPVNYPAGYGSSAIVSRDFNGDGKADFAILNSSNDTVGILLGNGNGTFNAVVNYPVGDNPLGVAPGDFNNDGLIDLAVANYYGNSISILIGNGAGAFAPQVVTALNERARSVAAGDVNGDGNLDVVVAMGSYSSGIAVLLGTGSGSLQSPVYMNVGDYPYAVELADFNADGKLDIVAARSGGAVVLKGNGDGTFQAYVLYGNAYSVYALAIADFNRDGKLDIALPGYYYSGVILLGNGDGTFTTGASFPTSYSSTDIEAEDINGDGKTDLIVSSDSYSGLSVLIGNGDGTFQAGGQYPSGYGAQRFVIGDFNGDGKADVALANYYDGVAVLLGGCPDLAIAKTHAGNFVAGSSGSYSIVVSNPGTGGTRGTVTVTDTLPSGLTATNINGSGWDCNLAAVTCTRSDTLGATMTFPAISLSVSVSLAASSSVTNTASVSGGADVNSANNTANDPTTITRIADLTIQKRHEGGTFVPGQTGRTYTITVGNGGSAPTSGTVTVSDLLPIALTATAMSGAGWSCNYVSRVCTRSDVLDANSVYPPITLTVSVNSDAPATIINSVNVSGGGDSYSGNNSASDSVAVLTAPAFLGATAASSTQVILTWQPVANATNYQVLRSSNNGPFNVVGAPLLTTFVDSSLTPNTTYLYRVRAADAVSVGALSNIDLATTMLFTDDPITTGATRIKAIHIMELRTAVNAVRAAANLPPATFTDPSLTAGSLMRLSHLTELRTALDQARAALGLVPMAYTDPVPAIGYRVKAAHIREIRNGVK